ncbi:oxygenase MpaB family protein [Mycobacteroides chelonae]|uniref:oxygenase MpaB family protein n=1 Tax=Mycobacteroides chelonae TaxID=1774 RepID=UPI000992B988|nr:oxygenase MpaB family protein [Mycobacteroides chelonae]
MTSTPTRDTSPDNPATADVDPETARPQRTSAGTTDDPLAEGSLGRDIVGHPLVLMYANVPALIMPTLHPKIAHVLSEKDRALNGSETIPNLQAASRRLISTYEMVMGIVFAGPEADEVAHGLHELHRPIAGSMPDGTSYHAWNKDVWNWTWGSILKGGLDIADQFRLFADTDEREQAYRALNEVGRRFGVRSLPNTYAEFCDYWQPIVENTLEVNPQVQFIVDHALNPAKPRGWGLLPTPLWRLISLPLTRTIRVGILAGVPEKFHADLGLRVTAIDRLERYLHAAFWRAIPVPLAGRFGPAYFTLRRRFGQPGWRTYYSRTQLAANRAATQGS